MCICEAEEIRMRLVRLVNFISQYMRFIFFCFFKLVFLVLFSFLLDPLGGGLAQDALKTSSLRQANKKLNIQLMSSSKELENGTFLYVRIQIAEGFHIYAPHTKGEEEDNVSSPPNFAWRLPKGVSVGAPVWPKASVIDSEVGKVHVLEDPTTVIAFPVSVTEQSNSSQRIVLKVKTSVCRDTTCSYETHECALDFPCSEANVLSKEPSVNMYSPSESALDHVQKLDKLQDLPVLSTVEQKEESEFFLILFFAFFGGIILNVMPCVLPVLSLKLLGLVQKYHKALSDHPLNPEASIRKHGLWFLSGVLISFLFLALLFLGLRSQMSWGFHLQSPTFVLFLMVLFTVMGLGLFGLIEIGVSFTRINSHSSLHHPYLSTFFQGTLITIVATPCTGPFMSTALAVAVGESPVRFLLIFLSLGLGVAFPFFIFCCFPQWSRFLPKPGNWMIVLKQFFGFCLLGTVIWLSSVYVQQTSVDALFDRIIALLLISFTLWIYSHYAFLKRKGQLFVILSSLSSSLVAGFFLLKSPEINEDLWQPYDEKKVSALQSQRRPYFIDFTAQWCLTCKINKKLVLTQNEIVKKFKEKKVTLFLGDYTKQEAHITKALRAYERAGVPVYVLYKGRGSPVLLPELLTVDLMSKELDEVNLKQ